MTLLRIVLFLGCVTLAVCQQYCVWTACKADSIDHKETCKEIEYESFSGGITRDNCTENEMRRQCCNDHPPPELCKYTSLCYRLTMNHAVACRNEFGEKYHPAGGKSCGPPRLLEALYYQCCPFNTGVIPVEA